MGIIGAVSQEAADLAGAALGTARLLGQGVINPKVDVLYSNSQLRIFQFSFFMTPSSSDEAQAMIDIIKTLRKYSAPELAVGGAANQQSALTSGYWFVPPAEFEITFHQAQNGFIADNIYLPKIGRCVINHIDVNKKIMKTCTDWYESEQREPSAPPHQKEQKDSA